MTFEALSQALRGGDQIVLGIFFTKDEHKIEHRTIFYTEHRNRIYPLHVFTRIYKLATAERIDSEALSVRVRHNLRHNIYKIRLYPKH